ncbi:YidC/Oxa1 family membrane protein insertase [Candidatus Planktophila lacus]|uniref:membrane protein insertase YidC n=1 Tax=Candidatus Planktophila lacus TaxID=1884913 RepID=UPI000BAC6DD9|nr:membrane protein insertase YidC [Candidatus Planktophila lacus]ASY29680.1 YidC/Oxa1 family membrane protein insertase [Candidatus Planktophila lacus]
MGFILNPLYNFVSGVIVGIHYLLSPIFGFDSGVTWALSIVGLVVLIRIILIPLFVKQIKSQRALTALQPQMKAIQNKYKDDRQKQSEEMMKLYKEHKTNPLASCFPILAQAPIFFALFTVLNGIAAKTDAGVPAPIARGFLKGEYLDSAAQATFFGAKISETFLGSPDTNVKIVTVILIFIMSATTFTTQRQLMVKGMPKMDSSNNMMLQQQKIMLYLFPVIFAVSGVNFPVGVLIYWSTTNFWTWGQQFYVIKRNPTPGSPAYEELQKKKAAKDKKGSKDSTGTVLDGTNPEDGAEGTNEVKGQRKQPKKKKKK